MSYGQYIHRKSSSNSDSAPAQNRFAPRQFKVQPRAEEVEPVQDKTPEEQTQGNQSKEVGRSFIDGALFARRPTPPKPPRIQMKLTIGQPVDKYQQEAEKVAADDVVQRVQSPENPPIPRQDLLAEDEFQRSPMVQPLSVEGGTTTTPNQEESIQPARGGKQNKEDATIKEIYKKWQQQGQPPLQAKQLNYSPPLNFNKQFYKLSSANSVTLALQPKTLTDPRPQGEGVGKNGVVFAEDGVNLRSRPSTNSSSAVIRNLSLGTKIFVDKKLSGGWYHVTLSTGEYGYVVATKINTNLPDPGAELHKVKSGESAIGIAQRYYQKLVQPGRDLRFYVKVLEEVNRQGGGIHGPSGGSWKDTTAVAGVYIWLPSAAFAKTFDGKVSSGSPVRDALAAAGNVAKTVGDFAVGGAALIAGLLQGALESIWSNLVGIKDLAVMVWDILKSLFTGNILNDGQNLWKQLTEINWGDLAQAWLGDFDKQWNNPAIFQKWQFRGKVLGYAAAEIALAVLTFGGATGAKWAGKMSAKAIQIIKEIPGVAKLAAQVSKIPVSAPIKKGLEQLRKIEIGKKPKKTPQYDPRIRQRAVADPGGHNFPFSFDNAILKTQPTIIRGGAQGYALRGIRNGKEVIFNIIVKDGKIVHRDMVSIKNWEQRSKSFGWPIKLEDIP